MEYYWNIGILFCAVKHIFISPTHFPLHSDNVEIIGTVIVNNYGLGPDTEAWLTPPTMITGCFFLRLSSFLWLTPTFAPIFRSTYLKYMSDRSPTISWWIYSSSIPRKHLGKVLVVVGCVGTEDITNTCWGRGYSQEGPTKPSSKFS